MIIIRIIKRFILSCLVLYTYNLLAVNINLMIPLNFFSIAIVYFLGVPGFFVLVLFKALMLWGDNYGREVR